MAGTETNVNELLQIRRDKLKELQDAGRDPFTITKYDVTHHSAEIKDQYDKLEGQEVSIAGRLMSKRIMGKASFCHVQDLQGTIQCYVARDFVGEESYKDFKKMDIGDIIGLKGTVFTTKTGEISVHAVELVLLSKSLQILPEKYHGLTNTDLRYRQRYVDLIMKNARRSSARSAVISMKEDSWKLKLPCLLPMQAAPRHALLRRISMHWMKISSCGSPWSCT